MALIALDPPSALPRGWYPRRPLRPACGTVSNAQLLSFGRPGKSATTPAGARIKRSRPSPPASTRHTETAGSCESRAARVAPAEPPPAIT
jgi:hypothetical protein